MNTQQIWPQIFHLVWMLWCGRVEAIPRGAFPVHPPSCAKHEDLWQGGDCRIQVFLSSSDSVSPRVEQTPWAVQSEVPLDPSYL